MAAGDGSAGIAGGIDRAFFSGQATLSRPPKPCLAKGVNARCGGFVVPENRAKLNAGSIALHVVVLPAPVMANPRIAVARKLDGVRVQVAEKASLGAPWEGVHIFDAESGERSTSV